MRIIFLLFFAIICFSANAQSKEEKLIRSMLERQTKDWNRGDLDAFMQPYWKSDSLMFIGKNGVVRGWQHTLDNYKKSYPDTASMGKLAFYIIQVKKLSDNYYSVVGKWMLKRSIGDISGHYTLLLQKKQGRWVIISDHSS
jgi:ketosteroid isomerase-like protein